ncbi:MAG: UDP-3-O-(3-hydroxymyristoyl)glucosamine N-acyltransferase [Ignavibacteria bacterium]
MKTSDIANIIGGTVEGDSGIEIKGIGKIETAVVTDITFISNPIYAKYFSTTKAGAVIVAEDFEIPENRSDVVVLRVKDPYLSFVKLQEHFEDKPEIIKGISKFSSVGTDTVLSDDILIDDFVKIGNKCSIGQNTLIYSNTTVEDKVTIGNNCTIKSNVTIYRGCIIGDNVIIHSGTVIGSDGFGFAKNEDGSFKKIPQNGIVRIEDNVEIGSNCSIDRAVMGETLICKGVKLDNQIQVAHNVEIGEDTVIAAQAGIAGSTKIGKRCMIAGQAGIVGHLVICDDVIIGASVGVAKSITQPGVYTGYRAKPMRDALKDDVYLKEIPKLKDRIKKLEENNK